MSSLSFTAVNSSPLAVSEAFAVGSGRLLIFIPYEEIADSPNLLQSPELQTPWERLALSINPLFLQVKEGIIPYSSNSPTFHKLLDCVEFGIEGKVGEICRADYHTIWIYSATEVILSHTRVATHLKMRIENCMVFKAL